MKFVCWTYVGQILYEDKYITMLSMWGYVGPMWNMFPNNYMMMTLYWPYCWAINPKRGYETRDKESCDY